MSRVFPAADDAELANVCYASGKDKESAEAVVKEFSAEQRLDESNANKEKFEEDELETWLEAVDSPWGTGLAKHAKSLAKMHCSLKMFMAVGVSTEILEQAGIDDAVKQLLITHAVEDLQFPMPKSRVVAINKTDMFVLSIDGPNQEFDAELHITLSWEDNLLPMANGSTAMDPKHIWKPALVFSNAIEDIEISQEYAKRTAANKVEYMFAVRGKFREVFELNKFPFDKQLLRTFICHNREKQSEIEITFKNDTALGRVEMHSDQVEWITNFDSGGTCFGHICFPNPIVGVYSYDRRHHTPGFIVEGRAQRKTGFYVYNLILPLCFIVSLGFLTAAVPHTEAATRLSVSLTLLLTAVAFKGTTSSFLPKISYFTYIDAYIVIGFIVLSLIVCNNALVYLVGSKHLLFDRIWFSITAAIWILSILALNWQRRKAKKETWSALRFRQGDSENASYNDLSDVGFYGADWSSGT